MGLLEEVFIGGAAGPRGPKREIEFSWAYIKDLGEEDLLELLDPPTFDGPRTLVKLRERHHFLAKLLAIGGVKETEAAVMTGYTGAYISMLVNDDPAFQELLAFYRDQNKAKTMEISDRLAMLGTTAVQILQERLDDPEAEAKLTVGQVQEIAEMALDRSIAPAKGGGKAQAPGTLQGVALNISFQAPEPKGMVIEGKLLELKATEDLE